MREQFKNVVGLTYRAMFEVPIDSRRTQFEASMSRTALPPDVVIEEIEAGGVSWE